MPAWSSFSTCGSCRVALPSEAASPKKVNKEDDVKALPQNKTETKGKGKKEKGQPKKINKPTFKFILVDFLTHVYDIAVWEIDCCKNRTVCFATDFETISKEKEESFIKYCKANPDEFRRDREAVKGKRVGVPMYYKDKSVYDFLKKYFK